MWKLKWLLAVAIAAFTATSVAQAQLTGLEDNGFDPSLRGHNGVSKIPRTGHDQGPFGRSGIPGRPDRQAQDPVNRWVVPGMAPGGMPVGRRDLDDRKDQFTLPHIHGPLPELSKFKVSDYPIAKDVKFTTTPASRGWFSGIRGRVGLWLGLAGAGLAGLFGRKKPAE
jgi:hypothetical protein